MLMVVSFLNERKKVVSMVFDSAYKCRLFVQKAKRSKRITLLSYPNIINE